MNRNHIQLVLLVLVLALSGDVGAADFAGGAGTWDAPYQIATAEQLISIGSDHELLESHYVLVADIDLDPNLSQDYAFTESPIGSGFRGVLDGRGHRVRNLTIADDPTDSDADCGLFRSISAGGEVKRLIFEDVHIVSNSCCGAVGALCASNYGVILQCSVTGVLSGNARSGGLVSSNYGVIEECCGACVVSGPISGGLVGENRGRVQDCYASGRVLEGPGDRISIGGLVGDNRYTIVRCYADCQVISTSDFSGGLAGGLDDRGTGAGVEDSYFLDPSEEGGPDNGVGASLTAQEMREWDNFDGWDFWETDNDGRRGIWYVCEDGPPELVWRALSPALRSTGEPIEWACDFIEASDIRVGAIVYDYDHAMPIGYMVTARPQRGAPLDAAVEVISSLGPYDWAANAGNGDAESPYLIASAGQLDCLAHEPSLWGRHFTLISDLDLAGRVYGRPLLGHLEWGGAMFDGTFDGDGHLIRNLTIEGYGAPLFGFPTLGLFGEVGASGCVEDLGLAEVSIKGRGGRGGDGGMLCAVNEGRIERCYSVGTLAGDGILGGLVGLNAGGIEDCYARGRIWRMVEWDAFCAGLVSWNLTGTIRTCYAACSVPTYWGDGLVSTNEEGSIDCCFWDMETSGANSSAAGMGLTTDKLMSVRMLQQYGWGGNPSWIVDDGKDYPRLIWEGTPGMLIPEGEMGL